MYHFFLGNQYIGCDTLDELHAAVSSEPGTAKASKGAKARGSIQQAMSTLAESANGHATPTRRKPGPKPGRKPIGLTAARSWKEARKEASRQGRTDVAKVRSEIADERRRARSV